MSYLGIGALTAAEIVGDFGFKKFAKEGGIQPFIVGTVGYIGVIFFLIVSLQNSNVLLVNAAWDGISALVESIAAYLYLGERFHDPHKYIGIAFIVIGLLFLKMPMVSPHSFHFPSFFI